MAVGVPTALWFPLSKYRGPPIGVEVAANVAKKIKENEVLCTAGTVCVVRGAVREEEEN